MIAAPQLTAHKALFALVSTAVDRITQSRALRDRIPGASDDAVRMQLASEAMNLSMLATESVTRALELACNMFALGITAAVAEDVAGTPEPAPPAFTPRIVGAPE